MTTTRLLIVADDHLTRTGLASLLDDHESISVVGQVDSQINFDDLANFYRADVILWDLGWEIDSVPEELNLLLQSASDNEPDDEPLSDAHGQSNDVELVTELPPILVLVSIPEQAAGVWRAGAQGILLRTIDADLIATALNTVVQGLLVLDPELSTSLSLSPGVVGNPESIDLIEPLTPREREVLQLVAEGLPNKVIARQLDISEHTVKFHLNAILSKLNASSRTEAVVRATRAGLILI